MGGSTAGRTVVSTPVKTFVLTAATGVAAVAGDGAVGGVD